MTPIRTVLAALALALPQGAVALDTDAGPMRAEAVVEGLNTPWAFGFLPDGTILITEREGQVLARAPDGTLAELTGLPPVAAVGQGGLLDLLVPRDFVDSRQIFLTYAKPQGRGEGTAVLRARLEPGQNRLADVTTIFEIASGSRGGRHFGSRLAEAPDGSLFVTVGDRGDDDSAQDLSRHNGSVLRLTREGAPHPDNPFLGRSDALPEIWSFGHRNPQGAVVDSEGQLWVNEHGARGGDEVNRVARGANYGWPVIAYGRQYSGLKIGEGTAKPGMEQPVMYWDPSIAPSGMAIYDGPVADWRGDAFVGSLKFDYIARLEGTPLREVERIEGPETARVRDVRSGPDGALWFLSEGNGALYRVVPR